MYFIVESHFEHGYQFFIKFPASLYSSGWPLFHLCLILFFWQPAKTKKIDFKEPKN